jgi:hypothetical protein
MSVVASTEVALPEVDIVSAAIAADPAACTTELAAKAARTAMKIRRTKNFMKVPYLNVGRISIEVRSRSCERLSYVLSQ